VRIIFVVVVVRSELLIISRMRETSFSSFTSILMGIFVSGVVSGVEVLVFAAFGLPLFRVKALFCGFVLSSGISV